MDNISGKKGGGFKTAMAIMMAFVTLMSAVAAWRASVAADEAGDADLEGITATLQRAESYALNELTAYEHYRAFAIYLRYVHLGDLLYRDMENASDEVWLNLDQQRAENYSLGVSLVDNYFPSDYLNKESETYEVDRELQALVADDARYKDIYPEPHFDRAKSMRAKSNALVSVLVVLAIALWFFTLAEFTRNALKYGFAVGGFVFAFIAVASIVVIEFLL